MTTYRITARVVKSGVVIYVGTVEAGGERLAVNRAMQYFPKYNDRSYALKAEPMLLRWPCVGKA